MQKKHKKNCKLEKKKKKKSDEKSSQHAYFALYRQTFNFIINNVWCCAQFSSLDSLYWIVFGKITWHCMHGPHIDTIYCFYFHAWLSHAHNQLTLTSDQFFDRIIYVFVLLLFFLCSYSRKSRGALFLYSLIAIFGTGWCETIKEFRGSWRIQFNTNDIPNQAKIKLNNLKKFVECHIHVNRRFRYLSSI